MLPIDAVICQANYEANRKYKEGKNNYNIYSKFFDENVPDWYNGKKQNVSYCAIFVHYLFCKSYGVENARKMLFMPKKSQGASSTYCYNQYKKNGAVIDKPVKGCQIFFKNTKGICHTGIVIDVDKTHVYTVEGNKSGDVSVRMCKYPLKSTKIYGFGMPDYNIDNILQDPVKPEKPEAPKTKYLKGIITAPSGLRIRSKPSINADILGLLKYGTEVEITKSSNPKWYKYKNGFIRTIWVQLIK